LLVTADNRGGQWCRASLAKIGCSDHSENTSSSTHPPRTCCLLTLI